jgi:hypothetical protein
MNSKYISNAFKITFTLFLAVSFFLVQAQETNSELDEKKFLKPVNTGLELQWYPTGIIPSMETEWIINHRLSLSTRIGMNLADRKDFSEFHDHEEGSAFGGSLGFRYYLTPNTYNKWFLGLRTDLWDMTIDWENYGPPSTKGATDILILQPTLELGYLHQLGTSPWNIGAAMALGFEINIVTVGEEVAQGKVSLLSLNLNRIW